MVGDYWGWGRYALLAGRVIKNRDVQLAERIGPPRSSRFRTTGRFTTRR